MNIKKIKHYIPGLTGIVELGLSIVRLPTFIRHYQSIQKSSRTTTPRFTLLKRDWFFCLCDTTSDTPFDPHYTYHPAWAARVVARVMPKKHIDIASTLKFCTLVSAFVPVEFYDYRPANLKLSNLVSKFGDLHALPFTDNSVESLSCMHTIEHVGLGRYGDPIDYDGDIKAAKELARVLAPNGSLIFVTPVGAPRIEFNAHRIYSYEQVLALFPDLVCVEFSLVPDEYHDTGIIEHADPALVAKQRYACGCFVFVKKQPIL
jgi:SAM-dependent methyltransferase